MPTPSHPVLRRDLLLATLVTGVALLELWLVADQVEGPLMGHLVLNLLILPVLAFRRTWPLVATLLAALGVALQPLVGSSPVATGFLGLLFVLASLGWYADTRTGVIGVSAVLAGGVVAEVGASNFLVADLVVNLVIIVAAWAGARGVRVATDHRIAAELAADRSARVAVQEERARISRDLHDSLAHALTLITLQAGGARERTSDPLAEGALGTIEDTGREALADLQRCLRLLEASSGEPPGITHLPDLVEGVRRSGLSVCLAVDPGPVPQGVSTAVYRVVQEALTNVVRHSDASTVSVAVTRTDHALVTEVSSVARTKAPVSTGSGRGLVGLRERLALFGGTLESRPTPDGWRLQARIPLEVV